jgi:phosphoglycolate phosphatase
MKALLLDLDRTLVDVQTYTDYETAVADVSGALGAIELVGVPETEWRSATRTAMATLVALAGDPDRWQRASDLIERCERDAVPQSVAMPGLVPFLQGIQDIPRAIVTLMGPGAMDAVCATFNIDVAVRVGRSADLVPKPAPDQVLRACRLLGVAPAEALMLGDSTWDGAAAAAAGAAFIGITNGRPSEFPPGTRVVSDLGEALSLIR